jgi:hypothetical protein
MNGTEPVTVTGVPVGVPAQEALYVKPVVAVVAIAPEAFISEEVLDKVPVTAVFPVIVMPADPA